MTTASSIATYILLVLVIAAAIASAWAFHADRRDDQAEQDQLETEQFEELDHAE